jgi:hypothetical protein
LDRAGISFPSRFMGTSYRVENTDGHRTVNMKIGERKTSYLEISQLLAPNNGPRSRSERKFWVLFEET